MISHGLNERGSIVAHGLGHGLLGRAWMTFVEVVGVVLIAVSSAWRNPAFLEAGGIFQSSVKEVALGREDVETGGVVLVSEP